MADEYPTVVKPSGLGEDRPRFWTDEEAAAYFDWITATFVHRTDVLLYYFAEDFSRSSVELLNSLGVKVAAVLQRPEYSHLDDREITILGRTRGLHPNGSAMLTARGRALGLDMGLLMARLLLRDYPFLAWATPQETRGTERLFGRSYTSVTYNSPTLVGLDRRSWFTPGLMLGVAASVASRRWPPEKWANVYKFKEDTASTESEIRAVLDRSRSGFDRGMFARMLGQSKDLRAREILLDLLREPDHELLKGALSGLEELGDVTVLESLQPLTLHRDKIVARHAAWAMKKLTRLSLKAARKKSG